MSPDVRFAAAAPALVAALVFAIVAAGCTGEDDRTAAALRPFAAQWESILAAEDARAPTTEQLDVLRDALRSPEPEIRRIAVRALGRLERPNLVPDIAPILADPVPRVRAEAARAMQQSTNRMGRAAHLTRARYLRLARRELLGAVAAELRGSEGERPAPFALAAMLEALGRLQQGSDDAAATAELLARQIDENAEITLGAARGLFFLARQPPARGSIAEPAGDALMTLATLPVERRASPAVAESRGRARTLALATLVATGTADEELLGRTITDPDPLVRREAVIGAAVVDDTDAQRRLLATALADSSGIVRYEALRSYGRRLARSDGCDPVYEAIADENAHVFLAAIEILASACARGPNRAAVTTLLDSLAGSLPPAAEDAWHPATRAITGLAATDPEAARSRLPEFEAHPSIFVRSAAARAATMLRDTAALYRLVEDEHPNVRATAIFGLRMRVGRAADTVFLTQLEHDDSQLLQAAAAALDGSRHPGAAVALFDALDRVTAMKRETSRDARRALLRRAQQLGRRDLASRVRPYLNDFDPEIAELAANVLRNWTRERVAAAPMPLEPAPLPSFEEIAALNRAHMVIEMDDGGIIELRLLAFDAPTNVARFARLAREGYYDGLTLHRVVPNFVVQGGSPRANEYSGDGPYTRDEIGAANWRGTVGLSIRGRDTGDAQFFFNLVHNLRFNPDYTVWAEVVHGLDVVDGLLEGAVMRRVSVRP